MINLNKILPAVLLPALFAGCGQSERRESSTKEDSIIIIPDLRTDTLNRGLAKIYGKSRLWTTHLRDIRLNREAPPVPFAVDSVDIEVNVPGQRVRLTLNPTEPECSRRNRRRCLRPTPAPVTFDYPVLQVARDKSCGVTTITAGIDKRPVDGAFRKIEIRDPGTSFCQTLVLDPLQATLSSTHWDRLGGGEVMHRNIFRGPWLRPKKDRENPGPDPLPPPPLVTEYSGWNKNGTWQTCQVVHREPIACTTIYGPDEEFRDACTKSGARAFTCGCHSYLCSERLSGGNSGPIRLQ